MGKSHRQEYARWSAGRCPKHGAMRCPIKKCQPRAWRTKLTRPGITKKKADALATSLVMGTKPPRLTKKQLLALESHLFLQNLALVLRPLVLRVLSSRTTNKRTRSRSSKAARRRS